MPVLLTLAERRQAARAPRRCVASPANGSRGAARRHKRLTMPATPSGSISSTTVMSTPSMSRMWTLIVFEIPVKYWIPTAPSTAPRTLRRPPTNSMMSSDSSAVACTSVGGTNSCVPA